MSSEREIPWVIEDQTKVKHQLLNDYIEVWMVVIFRQQKKLSLPQKVVYIDGFSGPGLYWADEKKESTVAGSPMIVAEIAKKCIQYDASRKVYILAIDNDKRCASYAQKLLTEKNIYKQDWEVCCDSFEVAMRKILDHLKQTGKNIAPAFVFIDNFGYSGFPMETLGEILKHPRTELFINLMVYDIARFLTAEHAQEHMFKLFGTAEYKKGAGLIEEKRISFIAELYCRQLKTIAKAEFIQPFRVNTPDQGTRARYFLIHASQNLKALKEMKNAMRKSSAQPFRFEAIGLDSLIQFDLFKPTGEEEINQKIHGYISSHLRKMITYNEIIDWAYQHTDGIEKDFKKALIDLAKVRKIQIERKPGQKKHTITDGAFVGKIKRYE